MKKIISLTLCMALLFSLAARCFAEDFSVYDSDVIFGDVSGDGNVTAYDARIVLRYVAKLQDLSREQLNLADVDGNSVVDASDARHILRMNSKPSLQPSYDCINNVSLSFYVANSKAYVSYFAASKKSGIDVTVKLYKGDFSIFSFASDEKSTDKKYINGLFTAPVNGSAEYKAEITVESGGEKIKKSMTFTYDSDILLGDINSDGKVTAADARLILRYSAKLQKLSRAQLKLADIDRNSVVNVSDARFALIMASRL